MDRRRPGNVTVRETVTSCAGEFREGLRGISSRLWSPGTWFQPTFQPVTHGHLHGPPSGEGKTIGGRLYIIKEVTRRGP